MKDTTFLTPLSSLSNMALSDHLCITERRERFNPRSWRNTVGLLPWIEENVKIGYEIETLAPFEVKGEESYGETDYDAEPEILTRQVSSTLTTTINFKPSNTDPQLFPEKQAKQLYDFLDAAIPSQIQDIGRNDLFNDFESDMSSRQKRNFADGIFDSGNFYDFYRELIEKQELHIESLEEDFEKDEDTDYSPVDDADLEKLADLFAQDIDGLSIQMEDVDLTDTAWSDSSEDYSTTIVGSTVKVRTTVYQTKLEYPELMGGSGEFDSTQVAELLDNNGIESDDYEYEEDGSLDDTYGIEIITKRPKPYTEAVENFTEIMKVLKDNRFKVNKTTGMHISFSIKSLRDYKDVNWLKVMVLSGTDYIQKAFGRLDNSYVESMADILRDNQVGVKNFNFNKMKELEEKVSAYLYKNKYVNLGLRDFNSKGGRIEYRVPGGADMFNTDMIISHLNSIINSVYYGLRQNEELYKEQYYLRLYSIINKILGDSPARDPLSTSNRQTRQEGLKKAAYLAKEILTKVEKFKKFVAESGTAVLADLTRIKTANIDPQGMYDLATNHIQLFNSLPRGTVDAYTAAEVLFSDPGFNQCISIISKYSDEFPNIQTHYKFDDASRTIDYLKGILLRLDLNLHLPENAKSVLFRLLKMKGFPDTAIALLNGNINDIEFIDNKVGEFLGRYY